MIANLGQIQPHCIPNTAFLTIRVKNNTPNSHMLYCKRGQMPSFRTFAGILLTVMPYPIISPSHPLVAPNTH